MAHVYLGLGTNLGDRQANLQAALAGLAPQVQVLRCSPVYETAPWGVLDQPVFLNMAVEGITHLDPKALLHYLKNLEIHMGRTTSVRYGPRLVDLDILFYGDLVLDTPDLIIPHPHLHERAFVLVPLADLVPDFPHPRLGSTVRELLDAIDISGIIQVFDW